MTNPKLALIPSGYKGGTNPTVYSILPNDGSGDFTFSRTGEATRVRKDGLIEEVTDDIPRLDWLNSDCPSLLLEPQRVNRQFYSEQIDNAVWSKVSTTVTADQTIAPSGEYTADKVQRTSTVANYVIDSASKSASAELDITTSMFVKKGEGDFFAIRQQGSYPNRGEVKYQFSTNTLTTSVAGSDFTVVGSSVEDYGNGWVRISATFNTDASSTVSTLFSPRATDGTVDASDTSDSAYAYVWGVQVEEGYPTSYIKTEGSTVTRLKDECLNGGDGDLFNISEGTFFVDATNFEGTETHIGLSDGTDANKIAFIYKANGYQLRIYVSSDSGVSLDTTQTILDAQRNKVALTFKENEFKVFINGSLVHTDTSGSVPLNFTRLDFANRDGTAAFFEGKVYDTRVYDRVLTEAEAIELTTL
jgi:hypothetical protein